MLSVPGIRQIVIEPLYAAYSYSLTALTDFFGPISKKQNKEIRLEGKRYPEINLPDAEVLFAEDISEIDLRDPLEEFRVTPVPEDQMNAAQWVYLEEYNDVAASGSDTAEPVSLVPPVFEHTDLFNSGPAALSALLRYNGIPANQYEIANVLHPESKTQSLPIAMLQEYMSAAYPEMKAILRENGTIDILKRLLDNGFPAVVQLRQFSSHSFYPGDDRFFGRFLLVCGYDPKDGVIICQDPDSETLRRIPFSEFAEDWYCFGRPYFLVFSPDQEETVNSILGDNKSEKGNLTLALAKYKTDVENLPDDPFSLYNYASALYRSDQKEDAWEYFQKAFRIGLPQRYFSLNDKMLQCAFDLGCGDDMLALAELGLHYDRYDPRLLIDKGWALLLKNEREAAGEAFAAAAESAPQDPAVQYALKYLEGYG